MVATISTFCFDASDYPGTYGMWAIKARV